MWIRGTSELMALNSCTIDLATWVQYIYAASKSTRRSRINSFGNSRPRGVLGIPIYFGLHVAPLLSQASDSRNSRSIMLRILYYSRVPMYTGAGAEP